MKSIVCQMILKIVICPYQYPFYRSIVVQVSDFVFSNIFMNIFDTVIDYFDIPFIRRCIGEDKIVFSRFMCHIPFEITIVVFQTQSIYTHG